MIFNTHVMDNYDTNILNNTAYRTLSLQKDMNRFLNIFKIQDR